VAAANGIRAEETQDEIPIAQRGFSAHRGLGGAFLRDHLAVCGPSVGAIPQGVPASSSIQPWEMPEHRSRTGQIIVENVNPEAKAVLL
jgi:hypothetical protein